VGPVPTTGSGQAPSGSAIAGTTRTPTNLDAFETGSNGTRFNTFWQPDSTGEPSQFRSGTVDGDGVGAVGSGGSGRAMIDPIELGSDFF
jgi:hypothetical protein